MHEGEASSGWCGDECHEVGVCIVLDRPGDGKEFKANEAKQMSDLLTALHLEVVIVDLRIRMLEAIQSGCFDLAMTMQLLILVRMDELDAYKFAMSPSAWAIYETMHP